MTQVLIRGPSDPPKYVRGVVVGADAWMAPCGCTLVDHSAAGTDYEFARCATHHGQHVPLERGAFTDCRCLECFADLGFVCLVVAAGKHRDFERMMEAERVCCDTESLGPHDALACTAFPGEGR